MVKKVKAYLNNAEIIEDEDVLVELSNQCEPSMWINLWNDKKTNKIINSWFINFFLHWEDKWKIEIDRISFIIG